MGQLRANIDFLESLWLAECDSRVVKALRVQPLTGCMSSYADSIVGPLDLGSLTFPYSFDDGQVEEVWNAYRAWAETHRERIDRLLAAARGEVRSESQRLAIKTALAKVRDCDLDAVSALVDQAEAAAGLAVSPSVLGAKEGHIVDAERLAGAHL